MHVGIGLPQGARGRDRGGLRVAGLFIASLLGLTAALALWALGFYGIVILTAPLPGVWEWIFGAPAGFAYVGATAIAWHYLFEEVL